MADRALDILSVAEFKTAIRFVGDDSHDAHIIQSIAGAVSYIDEQTNCGILARDVEYTKERQSRDESIAIPLKHNARLEGVEYDYPTVTGSPLTPVEAGETTVRVGRIEIAPPTGGWQQDTVRVSGLLSIAPENVPPVLKHTAILLAQRLYDGEDVNKGDWAVDSLLIPYKSVRGAAPGLQMSMRTTRQLTGIILRVGWAADATEADMCDLSRSSENNAIQIPASDEQYAYLVIWRADRAGGLPDTVDLQLAMSFSARPEFSAQRASTIDRVPGQLITSVYPRDTAALAGVELTIANRG